MKRYEKRPLKDHNIVESPNQAQGLECPPKCDPSSTRLKENQKKRKRSKRKAAENISPQESPKLYQAKVDQYFTSPKSTPSRVNKGTNLKNDEDNENDKSTSNVPAYNQEELILTVNKFFMNDLRCPRMTPFSTLNFSCSSVTNCVQNHKEPVQQLFPGDEQLLMFLVCEKCWHLLIPPLTCHLTERTHFSPLLLRSIFYVVTVEKQDETSLKLVDIFKTHLKFHPACRKDMTKIYHEVLLGNIKIEHANPDIVKYDFHSIIKAVEETCLRIADEEAKNSPTKNQKLDKEDSAVPSTVDELFSYIKSNYINNDDMLSLPEFNRFKSKDQPTENKSYFLGILKRLMLIFDIALSILEENFRMWLMKSRYKLKEKMCGKNSCPLIAEVAWKKSEEIGSINEHCVQIFMLFKACPEIYRHHLSRYIALLFEVAQANEDNKEMEFPFFSCLCNRFAHELSSHIMGGGEDITGKTMDLVHYVYPDWLRFKVGGILLKSEITSGDVDDLLSFFRIISRNLSKEDRNKTHENISHGRNLRIKLKLPNRKINVKNSAGETLLHKYCRSNNVKALKSSLQNSETNVNLADNAGWTALHNAASYNSIDCVKLLVDYRLPPKQGSEKLDIFHLNSDNESPLMCAVKHGHTEIVDILLKNGAGPTVWNKNSEGFSSVDLAPNELLREILQSSWRDSISSFEFLSMTTVEVELLTVMFSAYTLVYHIHENYNMDCDSSKRDVIIKFNYTQFFKDKTTLEMLSLLLNRLLRNPSNPKNLCNLLFYINSYNKN